MSGVLRPGGSAETSRSDLDWQDRGACRDGEDAGLFFAPEVESATARERREARAKRICSRCPVRVACLEWRLQFEHQQDAGVWGGKNEDERWTIRKRRIRALAAKKRAA